MKKYKRHRTISSAIAIARLKHKAIWLHGNNCLKCGSDKNIELDHIKPAVYYPELFHKFYNVQILCKKCNLNKRDKIEDYREEDKKYEIISEEKIKEYDFYYNLHKQKYPVDVKWLKKKLKGKI